MFYDILFGLNSPNSGLGCRLCALLHCCTWLQDNKCGWLVVQALDLATPAQRQLLEANYAKKDPECEARVKALYVELGLEAVSI